MKKKKLLLVIFVLFVISVCLFIIFNYFLQDYQPPKTTPIGNGYIYFNPDTILGELESGIPVFTQEIEQQPGGSNPDNSNVKLFSEDEFMYIANRFFETHWQEDDISDWKLVNVKYVLYDCNAGMSGNVLAKYIYEKNLDGEKNKIYERTISVITWEDTIGWNEKKIENTLLSSEIDQKTMVITAKDAFQISREYSWAHINESLNLSCSEVSMLLLNQRVNTWYIDYWSPNESLLSVEINAETGKVKEK